MRLLFFLLFPVFLSAQINRAYGVIEIGATFPSSSSTGPKFAYRPVDSSFYRWVSGNTWVKVVEPSIIQDTLYLTEELGTTVKLNGDTINLIPYLLKSDTMSMLVRYIERGDTLGMLSAYIRSAGWGLLKSSYTLRADSSLLATKTYTNRFIVPSGQVAVGTGSGLIGYANLFWDNANTRLGIGTNSPSYFLDLNSTSAIRLPRGTDAEEPTSAAGLFRYNTTGLGYTGNDGSGRYYLAKSDIVGGGGTNTYVPHFNSNGRLTQSGRIRWNGAQTEIYGSTNAYSTNTKSFRVFSLNSTEMFYVNDNGQFGGDGFLSSQGNVTVGRSSPGYPEYLFFGEGSVNETVLKHEASDALTIGRTYGQINIQKRPSSGGTYPNGTFSIWSKTGINSNNPIRDLDVNGEVRVRDLTTDTPTKIVGADADGDLGIVPVSSSLKIASGVLDLKHKSLIDSLPIASVSIDAAGNDLEILGLNSLNFEFEYTAGTITSDGDVMTIEQDSEINFITGQDSELRLGSDANIQATNTEGVIGIRVGGENWIWHYVNDDAFADEAMKLTTVGNEAYLTLTDYGLGNITVATVSENPGLNIPVFTPTGKVLEMRITRDTFVEDQTLFSVGTLLYTCDHLFINTSMTGTAAANMEIRFPDPAEAFRGKKITVYSGRKDAGLFAPQIKVAGGSSRLRYTTDSSIAGSMPSDQSALNIDGVSWSYNGVSYDWTCIKIDSTNYRWVLKQ